MKDLVEELLAVAVRLLMLKLLAFAFGIVVILSGFQLWSVTVLGCMLGFSLGFNGSLLIAIFSRYKRLEDEEQS